ncbi:hypothetical protein QKW35_11715 [Pontibacterium granulatum]|uniref:hypothetical protein n=1 Tax=Pontibacterium granulatum TaxID=2036029 RepID=UPI00249ACDDB|nr:hypothetical protein [Pontibacterium granulatum]MDI3325047.1 hypothetical protein [Pontibacterium granulatum]
MVVWSDTELWVFGALVGMVLLKLWSVWHVSVKAKADRNGRLIFLGLIIGLTLFGVGAKTYISMMMGV